MKIPEKAPAWDIIFKKTNFIAKAMEEGLVQKLHKWVDEEYLYWDKFKYQNLSTVLTPEEAWAFLKFLRLNKSNKIALTDLKEEAFSYCLTNYILRSSSDIDKFASGTKLISDIEMMESKQKKYLIKSLMEEAITSGQLEGAATTREKAKEMLLQGRAPKDCSEQMIFNNYKTISKIKELVDVDLSKELILEIHRLITCGTLDDMADCGAFRTKPVYVQSANANGEILYTAPPACQVESMIEQLIKYANEESKLFIHPVVKAIVIHFYFGFIHPFVDGNGRTARALFYWYVLKHGYDMFEYLSISRIFLQAPSRYAKSFLYTEIDDLDLTYFIHFNIQTIMKSINDLISYIKNQQKEKEDYTLWEKYFETLNERQIEVMKYLIRNPFKQTNLEIHKNLYDIAYETARTDLFGLVEKELLIKKKKGKAFYFSLREKFKL